MAFFEHLFPQKISLSAEGGPRFLTSKAYGSSGQRVTNRDASQPLHQYRVSLIPMEGDAFDELKAFFYVVGGDCDGFRFKDWSDYQATADNTKLVPVPGHESTWQLCRVYEYAERQFVRTISKPVEGAQVFRKRSGSVAQLSVTPDPTTGRVVIEDHESGDTYHWIGEFHVPVAFRDPSTIWNIIGGPKMITSWPDIELEEIRI